MKNQQVKNKQQFYRKQHGWALPQILVVSLLILYISLDYSDSGTAMEHLVSAQIAESSSAMIVDATAKAIDSKIRDTDDRPYIAAKVSGVLPTVDLEEFKVWHHTYDNYNLKMTSDPLIDGRALQWWEQPEVWWQDYADQVDVKTNDGSILPVYVIMEYAGTDSSGADLSQSQFYYQKSETYDFNLTVRGAGHQGSMRLISMGYKHTYF